MCFYFGDLGGIPFPEGLASLGRKRLILALGPIILINRGMLSMIYRSRQIYPFFLFSGIGFFSPEKKRARTKK